MRDDDVTVDGLGSREAMEIMQSDNKRECLQCGETPAGIKRQGIVLCGIVSGYYEPELTDEWPRHRWADWRDSELARFGVKPDAFERHRRTPALTFQWIACDDTVAGHRPAAEDDADWGVRKGQCIFCGAAAIEKGSSDV